MGTLFHACVSSNLALSLTVGLFFFFALEASPGSFEI